jgi:hypothetical protein
MQRNEAISYLKALLGTDFDISPELISFEKQEDQNIVKIRIKTQERERIRDTAKKLNLEVNEENGSIIIYA